LDKKCKLAGGQNVGCVVATGTRFFNCPNRNALYQIIKVETGSESVDHEVTWRACDGPFSGREGKFALNYFL
jgi:hypothetical protein